ncbi:Protein FAR1-like sequence 6 [Apostasia shenzhenica]|uniref:Protein FAR1-like sequence 6 n=1 Tax=Apostasia shenzhenica TaxID=1088818 RepID=A0A2I0AZP6_9ASPA|nr:Protein FAR1-like sequence 6 [Apostasia shenzhenica]
MAEEMVPVMCYHGGKIVMQGRRPDYDGGSMDGVLLKKSATYSELLKRMYELTTNDPKQFKLVMKCRFPTTGSDYVALEVKDEMTTKMMFGLYPRVYSLELFLESIRVTQGQDQVDSMVRVQMDMVVEGSDSLSSSMPAMNEKITATNKNCFPDEVSRPRIPSNDNFGRTTRDKGRFLSSAGTNDADHGAASPNPTARDGSHSTEPIDLLLGAVDDAHQDDIHIEDMEEDSNVNDPDWKSSDEEDDDDLVTDSIIKNTCRGLEDDPSSSDSLLHAGKVFRDKESLRQALQEYSIRRHVEYKVVRSCKMKLNVRCTQQGCPWQVRAILSKRIQRFKIKTYKGDHTCNSSTSLGDHKQCDTKFISKCVVPLLKRNSTITPHEIMEWMKKEYNVQISYSKAWLGLDRAIKKIHGSWDESFSMLQEYLKSIQDVNPGTVILLLTNERGDLREFHRLFWSFGVSIEGFQNLRPLITIDSAVLHGKYSGSLFVATGVDGNNGLFPIAFAIAESETEQTWTWFLSCIRNSVTNRDDVTIISNNGTGLTDAVKAVYSFGSASHRYCMRHLSSSLRKEFKDETLVKLYWEAANKIETSEFDEIMTILGERNPNARTWLEKIGVEKWSFAHDGGKRFGIMTTNIIETCDSLLKGIRGFPIKALVGKTLSRLNKMFTKRREEGSGMQGSLTPSVESQLMGIVDLAGQHIIETYSATLFKVYRVNCRQYIVNIEGYSCTCNRYLISRIPCLHIVAVCMSLQMSYYDLLPEYFSSHVYRQTYTMKLHPVVEDIACTSIQASPITPPIISRRRGRPRSMRVNKRLPPATYRCGKCKQDGHSSRTCKSPLGTPNQIFAVESNPQKGNF